DNPALTAFVAEIKTDLVLAQVLVRRLGNQFELRHVQDRECDPENLRRVGENEIRALAQFTATDAFRPLKSAPNLQTGWRLMVADEAELEFALNQIYPGAMADWFAVRFSKAAPTNYREFANRQSGMYRITTMLSDEQAGFVVRACCDQKFCLKQRLWSLDGLAADSAEEKSLIPCLEPCAILVESARKAVRLDQPASETTEKGETANGRGPG
ncbi:MAG: DR2241 family protein, partial [Verrucomicrobiota bacterium]